MSPLIPQLMPIQIGGGVDTKTDDKHVISSKLLTLENGVFTNPGKINKRNGYQAIPLVISGGGTITNPQAVKAYNDELVCAAENSTTPGNGRLFSFSETLQEWVDKGKYIPSKVTRKDISSDSPQVISSGTTSGNYIAAAWIDLTVNQYGPLHYTIIDVENGTRIIPETLVSSLAKFSGTSTSSTGPQVCLVGPDTFAIIYAKNLGGATADLACRVATVSGGVVTLAAEVIIQAGIVATVGNLFDAVALSAGGAALVCQVGGTIKILTIDAAGTVTNTATIASAQRQFYINQNSFNGNIWVYSSTTSGTLRYAVFTSTLTPVLANTNTGIVVDRAVAASDSATQQTVYYYYEQGASLGAEVLSAFTVTSAGVIGTNTQFAAGGIQFSDPISVNNRRYLPLFYTHQDVQQIYVLMDVSDGMVVATALNESALTQRRLHRYGPIIRPFLVGTSEIQMVVSYQTGTFIGTSPPPQGTTLISFNFSDPDLNQAVGITSSLIWNGGVITDYDGQPCTELGFFQFPSVAVSGNTSGGTMADGSYGYIFIYQWLDNVGRLHQSAPSPPEIAVISGGGGAGSVSIIVSPLNITAKQASNNRLPVYVQGFRTEANGTIYHQLLGTEDFIPNTPFTTITFTDTQPDINITSNAEPYTTGGVVDNILPPPGLQMTIYNNRLWLVDSDSPLTVWYTKTATPGVGLSFSDLLTANIDERQGEITALAAFDDKIVYFKSTVPFFSVGDGANDLGLNATLSLPQIVASDVGCIASKSVLLNMPHGILFQSQKGIYACDRSLQMQYVGREVEAFNSEVITAATLDQSKSQIRFLTSSGVSLVHDYIYSQWSTFTNHVGLGADIWKGNYTYCRTDGTIYNETPGVFLDNAASISMKIGTAWIKLQDIQNYERLRNLFVTGLYKSKHLLNGQLYFDYESTVSSTFTFNPQTSLGVLGVNSVYDFRYHMERQKCETVRFVLFDSFVGYSAGEGYALDGLSIEAALKRGGNKLSQYKSVG